MSTGELSPRRRRRRFLVGYDEAELSVKREPEEDIKDYAETTMNELLGWYGYEKVDSRDTQGLNLTHFASSNPGGINHHHQHHNNNPPNGVSPPSSALEGSDGSEEVSSHHGGGEGPPSRVQSDSASPGPDVSSTASDEVARQHQQMVSALSSVTKHPGAPDSPNLPPGCIVCAWCQKVGMKLFTLKTPNGCKAFCSELCFTQCRRASFKKNKICDWCKHVRHTVNYVDFQDGEQQLQFCSDKCLNQYKMNIFCKETQAHLQMHTHLKEAACKMKASGSVNLITPELWLRDCKLNGILTSPMEAVDMTEEVNSDENLSANPSPTLTLESSRPSTPVSKEKKEQKQDPPPPLKERDKSSKKSSIKSTLKKVITENKHHSNNKHHRDKKANGMNHAEVPPISRHSPIQASPSHSRSGHITNGGAPSLLSPPPMTIPRPPPHHLGSLPPRHCPPPVPSPMGIGGMEPGRQPFMHPNMMPPPFQFLAQQQMEAFLRSQHGVDLRSKAPPPHIPIPPWAMPPFPPIHPPHQPPLQPSIVNSKNSSLSHSSPPIRTHHQSTSHKSSHQNKHKHSKRSSGHSSGTASTNSTTDSAVQFPPSLLPPVTVMVPFPIVLPLPLPIPVPIPIPPEVMEKYKQLKLKESEVKLSNPNSTSEGSNRKRKPSMDSQKNKKIRKTPTRDLPTPVPTSNQNHRIESSPDILQNEGYSHQIQNLSFRSVNSKQVDCRDFSKNPKSVLEVDAESRSYSPLSEGLSSNDDDMERTLQNGGVDTYPPINFSNYSLNLTRSSPVISQESERQIIVENSLDYHKSPSPTNLSVRQHSSATPSAMNFKKKHLREQLSLVDMNQCM